MGATVTLVHSLQEFIHSVRADWMFAAMVSIVLQFVVWPLIFDLCRWSIESVSSPSPPSSSSALSSSRIAHRICSPDLWSLVVVFLSWFYSLWSREGNQNGIWPRNVRLKRRMLHREIHITIPSFSPLLFWPRFQDLWTLILIFDLWSFISRCLPCSVISQIPLPVSLHFCTFFQPLNSYRAPCNCIRFPAIFECSIFVNRLQVGLFLFWIKTFHFTPERDSERLTLSSSLLRKNNAVQRTLRYYKLIFD